MRRLVLASGNIHKLAELAGMIAAANLPIEVHAARELGPAPTIVEDQDSFVAHAALKARGIAAWLRGLGEPADTLVLADDSGICVDALGGAPGVHSAVYAGPAADDAANNAALIAALKQQGVDRSAAHYVCVLALRRVDGAAPAIPGADPATQPDLALFTAHWHGEIRSERRGEAGFGYDPHFWTTTEAGQVTSAELTAAEKNARSHRGQAARALIAGLAALSRGQPR